MTVVEKRQLTFHRLEGLPWIESPVEQHEGVVVATHTFVVEEIHCGACESAIRKALTRLDGVRDVSPNSTTNAVTVEFEESQVGHDAIADRLALAGYPVVSS